MPKEDTQFKPGQSGNPGGRPKGLATQIRKTVPDGDLLDFQRALLYLDDEMLEKWKIKRSDVTLRDRQTAHNWLTERGHGKAYTHDPIPHDGDPLELGELGQRIQKLMDELAPRRAAKAAGAAANGKLATDGATGADPS